MSENYDYYRVDFKLKTPMLGTATRASIYYEHVLEKAKKEIAKANKLKKELNKVTKSSEKYVGDSISESKELTELQSVIRTYCQLVGRVLDMPDNLDELLSLATTLESEYDEKIKERDTVDATVFLRDSYGHPIISTHMILGNLKENCRVMVNGGDKSIIKSKVAVGETFALDVKAVEDYMTPSNDIIKVEPGQEPPPAFGKGKNIVDLEGRVLLERPIRFERMGKTETAIAASEQLPEGTEFGCHLRVRKGSPITEEALNFLLRFGRNNGFGSWRGSGNMGSYFFKLEKLDDFKDEAPEGWS